MSAKLLLGEQIAQPLRDKISLTIQQRIAKGFAAPTLAVVLVGENPASQLYVRNKKIACKQVGINTLNYDLAHDTQHTELLALIQQLNSDPNVDGILVQLPLPNHINTTDIIEHINPAKDVDGFHPYNLGRLAQGRPTLQPCTPIGIMQMLQYTQVPLAGKLATVIGRSNIVGLPMMLELLNVDATVTSCDRATLDLSAHVKTTDILIVATGNPELIKGSWIKPGSIVIDVGMNHTANGQLIGDVEFLAAKERAAWITPVPGGVGPMTIANLLNNTLSANMQRAE